MFSSIFISRYSKLSTNFYCVAHLLILIQILIVILFSLLF